MSPVRLVRAAILAALLPLFAWSAQASDLFFLAARVGEHATFDRIVFDWASPTPYRAKLAERRLEVEFAAAATFEAAGLKTLLPARIELQDVRRGDRQLVLVFEVPAGSELRDFFDGPRVVIDVLHPRPEHKATAEAAPEARPAPPAPPPATVAAASAPAALQPRAEVIEKGVRVVFPWKTPVAAAVFERAGFLWVVFDEAAKLDLSKLGSALSPRLGAPQEIAVADATVLRFPIRPNLFLSMGKNGDAWTLEIADAARRLGAPLEVRQQAAEGGAARLFLPVLDAGARIDVTDDRVGDTLMVLPVLGAGFGVARTQDYVEFSLLASAQGVAVHPLADWIGLERSSTGVAITGAGALALSDSNGAEGGRGDGAAPEHPPQLIDFDAWKRLAEGGAIAGERQLLYELSLAPEDGRNAARWNLARFYLAHDRSPEALGYLDMMAKTDGRLMEDPSFRAVRGVARLRMGRFGEASEDLRYPRLDAEPHANLWRAAASAGLGKWDEALDAYHLGAEAASLYREEDRALFQLAAARAALETGAHDAAETELSVLELYRLPTRRRAEIAFLRGRLLETEQDSTSALGAYQQAIDFDYRPVKARAEFAQTALLLKDGAIDQDEALDRLDRLRFSWRGGDVEFETLKRMGRIHVDKGDFRSGLALWRQAVTYFDRDESTRSLTREMGEVFADLFLGGGAEAMTPVAALALYYEFRELTPIGARGDEMIRKLSERLVAVDLFDRAEELLEHQVNFRMKGTAKAAVAATLARVYLMDRKPLQALKTIDATRQIRLPEQVERARALIEAKALTDLKRFDEAAEILNGLKGEDAEMLRADIHWGAKDWSKLTDSARGILTAREKDLALSPLERQLVMRLAVALALSDDKDGLKRLSGDFRGLMASTPEANAFHVVTTTLDPQGIDLKALANQIASVNTIEALIAGFREKS